MHVLAKWVGCYFVSHHWILFMFSRLRIPWWSSRSGGSLPLCGISRASKHFKWCPALVKLWVQNVYTLYNMFPNPGNAYSSHFKNIRHSSMHAMSLHFELYLIIFTVNQTKNQQAFTFFKFFWAHSAKHCQDWMTSPPSSDKSETNSGLTSKFLSFFIHWHKSHTQAQSYHVCPPVNQSPGSELSAQLNGLYLLAATGLQEFHRITTNMTNCLLLSSHAPVLSWKYVDVGEVTHQPMHKAINFIV